MVKVLPVLWLDQHTELTTFLHGGIGVLEAGIFSKLPSSSHLQNVSVFLGGRGRIVKVIVIVIAKRPITHSRFEVLGLQMLYCAVVHCRYAYDDTKVSCRALPLEHHNQSTSGRP
jgi:hypothetical protein